MELLHSASPNDVIKYLLGERDWPTCVAYAIAYLAETWWSKQPNTLRDHGLSESAADLLVTEYYESPDHLAHEVLRWLGQQSPTVKSILDFILAIDEGLERFAKGNGLDLYERAIEFGSTKLQVWYSRRGFLSTFQPQSTKPATVQTNETFSSTLESRLNLIRFLRVKSDQPPAAVQLLDNDAALRFAGLCERGVLVKPLRVGLFSVRGDFAPVLEHVRVDGGKYFFKVGDFPSGQPYDELIAAIVSAASHRDRGAHILILPEFMITARGREVLKRELIRASRDERLVPPVLTIAGSRHEAIPENGLLGNSCQVYSSSGELLWEQWKHERYGSHWSASDAQKTIHGFPDDMPPDAEVHVNEDIEWYGPRRIVRTPLGTMSIAICSDMMPDRPEAPAAYLAALPVDFLAVPAFTDRTSPFEIRAHELSKSLKVTLFVNAWPAVEIGIRKLAKNPLAPATAPPAQGSRAADEKQLASFLSTPWSGYPVQFWKDTNVPEDSASSFWMAMSSPAVDGLVVDLERLIAEASLPKN